jgi:hypothetical protein
MKKISILLLTILYLGITNLCAQNDNQPESKVIYEKNNQRIMSSEDETKECEFKKNNEGELVCVKTGKICNETCPKKAKNSCCKGEKASKDCSTSKNSSFNFNTSNTYNTSTKKNSCSKVKSKSCCKSKNKTEEASLEK